MTTLSLANSAPTLSGFAPALTLDASATPQLIDGDVEFSDAEGNFAGGALSLSGLLAQDRVAIRNEGTGAGQIGVVGSNVTYGGVVIGTMSGGSGTTFSVALNASASAAAVDALIENLTYAKAGEGPTDTRTLVLNVTDAAGADLAPALPTFRDPPGGDPLSSLGVRSDSNPALADWDGDGDTDILVGDLEGFFKAYRNDGGGSFTELTGAANPFGALSSGYLSSPHFADFDADGDLDMVSGNYEGAVVAFRNDGGSYVALTGAANPFAGIDAGTFSAPAFADLDGDGDIDLVVGAEDGTFHAFANDGGTFTELTGAANPLGAIDIGTRSSPAFFDYDGDGDADLVTGTYSSLMTFRNDGGIFTQVTGADNPFEGKGSQLNYFPAPEFGDVDGDGDIDLVAGDFYGRLHLIENVTYQGVPMTITVVSADKPGTANDDSATVAENSNVLIAVLDNDVDPDGAAIATVNGVALVPGGSTTLASGAIVTLRADGSLHYNPAGKFTNLAGGSGAVNHTATDSFVYTIVGGDEATVTVTVTGTPTPEDILLGHAGDDVISGTDFADIVDLTAGGTDWAAGEAGSDLFLLAASFEASDRVHGGLGNDTLRLQGDYSIGLAFNADSIADVETLQLMAGFDYALASHDGNVAAGKALTVDGRALGANDVLTFDGRAETDGAFDLRGGRGDDILFGGAMNDAIDGGKGDDRMTGGKGNDLYEVDDTGDKVIELAGEGVDRVLVSLSSYTLGANVENLRGMSNAGQRLTGNALGNDIRGGNGADTIDGGAGADTLYGNGGDDVYRVDSSADRVVEQAGEGNDTVFATASWSMVGSFVETLTLTGSAAIDGKGNGQANRINGNDAANRIDGGAGDDVLAGGGGRDLLTGGAGADGFLFDSVLGADNVDRATDFNAADDRFLLDRTIFSGVAEGVLDAHAFQLGAAANDAGDRILYDQASGNIFYDADGSGAGGAVLFATVEAGTILTAGDFFGV